VLLSKRSFLLIFIFGTPRGGKRTPTPLRYTPVPDLRKGNAIRCNIKRASPMGAPTQPLRGGGTRRGGEGARPPPHTPLALNILPYRRLWVPGGDIG